MSIPDLGTLKQVNLREAWSHEAHSFTPWLAQHLDKLATHIGIPLELEGQEVTVESFSADILARNSQDDSLVLIENQLENTDHKHLGQIMTYLAGLNAQTVIWIAADFREAHLSALKWLNEHTVEPFAFFAVKVKAVRIGDSPIAPLFEVVMRPNHWERYLQEIAKEQRVSSKLSEFRTAFWKHYLERYPDEQRFGEANSTSNRWRPIENLELVISTFVAKNSVGIFIRGLRGVDHVQIYQTLEPYIDQLAESLGVEVGNPDKGFFFSDEIKGDTSNPNNWNELSEWLYSRTQDYEQALRLIYQ